MQVIICGAGQVGSTIARYLSSENNDVTVIDHNPDLISRIAATLDVRPVVGAASHPHVLESAGAADADMLIAVTQSDEVNMVICQVAHSLFSVPRKIARVRSQDYLQPLWANLYTRDNMPIDSIISPEIVMAESVLRRLEVPGAMDVLPLAEGRLRLVGVRTNDHCPLVRTPLRQIAAIFPHLNMKIVGIVRGEEPLFPRSDEQIMPGDDVYFIVETSQLARGLAAFGHEEHEARRILVFGGGETGLFLAQQLEKHTEDVSVKVIEKDKDRAEKIAGLLNKTTVFHGDVLDAEVLDEAGLSSVETVIAVTDDDETNILSSLLAKKNGVQRTITLVNNKAYDSLVKSLGVDAVINPRAITVSTILQQVRRGRIHAAHSLHERIGEVIEADALETSPIVGTPIAEAKLPEGMIVGALIRDEDRVIIPTGATVIHSGDRVVLMAAPHTVKMVEKLFSVGLEYF